MSYADHLIRIKQLLLKNNAKIIAHYYVDEQVQRLAEDTGGFVGDSLEMARYGSKQKETTLIVAGVKFMGETAKILNPDKKVLMLDIEATCSLDTGCDYAEFKEFCDTHNDRIEHLTSLGKKLIWAPDKYLGNYVIDTTGADMLLWDGSCIVHEEYKTIELKNMIAKYPDCDVLVHPESPRSIIQLANTVGSTTKLIEASKASKKKYIIVATEKGILYQMKKFSPNKIFLEAPTEGEGATCKSCGRCPWMNLNIVQKLLDVFNAKTNEIILSRDIINKAKKPIDRMINFNLNNKINRAS